MIKDLKFNGLKLPDLGISERILPDLGLSRWMPPALEHISGITAFCALALLCFVCFAGATMTHFERRGRTPAGTWHVSFASLAAFAGYALRAIDNPGAIPSWAAWLLAICSLNLWTWAICTTRRAPPTLAGTDDEPVMLYKTGPYRFIRHPFYTAYLAFWTALAAAAPGWSGWALAAVLVVLYWRAARYEEAKFARSALAEAYRRYQARAGMFAPRFWGRGDD